VGVQVSVSRSKVDSLAAARAKADELSQDLSVLRSDVATVAAAASGSDSGATGAAQWRQTAGAPVAVLPVVEAEIRGQQGDVV
jgi:hypothetical protein